VAVDEYTGGAIGVAPTVTTVAVVDGTNVDITFSEANFNWNTVF
jgi:hypothetical protein